MNDPRHHSSKPSTSALGRLDCWTVDLLLSMCLSDGDLARFDAVSANDRGVMSPRVCGLLRLHSRLHHDEETSREVSDMLDRRYVAELVEQRLVPEGELAAASVDRRDNPGWLWALATDKREIAQRLSRALLRERLDAALRPSGAKAAPLG